jgi:ATP-dependent RNA helicase DeaD
MQSFDELKLDTAVKAAIAHMGISTPTPIQAQAIPFLLDGRDVIGQARTGSGKTLAFALPIVQRCDPHTRGIQALVLVPTRELAVQVGSVMEPLARARRLRLQLLYGGRSLQPEAHALAAGAQIVVGTPGRTLDHLRQGTLRLGGVHFFVLDEGDEMLDRGFAPDVERILGQTPRERQTALFSATVPEWVMATARKHLTNPAMARVDREVDGPPEIEHILYDVATDQKLAALRTLLEHRGDNPIIVFGRTKHGVKKLAKQLAALGYPAAALQGNMSQNARERVMADFRSGELPILLATNVAARGIDVSGIDQVINYELPESAELFTHRVGRTGRMGRQGEAITFITPEDAPKWRQIERALGRRLPRRLWPQGYTPVHPRQIPVPPPAPPVEPVQRAVEPRRRAAAPATHQRPPHVHPSRRSEPAAASEPRRPAPRLHVQPSASVRPGQPPRGAQPTRQGQPQRAAAEAVAPTRPKRRRWQPWRGGAERRASASA